MAPRSILRRRMPSSTSPAKKRNHGLRTAAFPIAGQAVRSRLLWPSPTPIAIAELSQLSTSNSEKSMPKPVADTCRRHSVPLSDSHRTESAATARRFITEARSQPQYSPDRRRSSLNVPEPWSPRLPARRRWPPAWTRRLSSSITCWPAALQNRGEVLTSAASRTSRSSPKRGSDQVSLIPAPNMVIDQLYSSSPGQRTDKNGAIAAEKLPKPRLCLTSF